MAKLERWAHCQCTYSILLCNFSRALGDTFPGWQRSIDSQRNGIRGIFVFERVVATRFAATQTNADGPSDL